jgi:hypothetical protein
VPRDRQHDGPPLFLVHPLQLSNAALFERGDENGEDIETARILGQRDIAVAVEDPRRTHSTPGQVRRTCNSDQSDHEVTAAATSRPGAHRQSDAHPELGGRRLLWSALIAFPPGIRLCLGPKVKSSGIYDELHRRSTAKYPDLTDTALAGTTIGLKSLLSKGHENHMSDTSASEDLAAPAQFYNIFRGHGVPALTVNQPAKIAVVDGALIVPSMMET